MNYNKVILGGRLTRDPELRHTNATSAVCNFGLAINHKYRTAAGEDREDVCFVDCEAWGKTAESIAKYLTKGRSILVEGRLKLDQWEDKQGTKQSKLRVSVDSFQFVDSAKSGADPGAYKPQGKSQPAAALSGIDDLDIPFIL